MVAPNLLQILQAGETTVVSFTVAELIDDRDIQDVAAFLRSLGRDQNRREVIVDFANVIYIRSRMFAYLVALHKTLTATGRVLTLRNIDRRKLTSIGWPGLRAQWPSR